MSKTRVTATLDPRRLDEAKRITDTSNVSALLDEALGALIEREMERRWLEAHAAASQDDDLPGQVTPDLGDLPWDA